MKIAYFIVVHHKATQFHWLWQAIYSKMDAYCIHIDAKSPETFHSEVRAIVEIALMFIGFPAVQLDGLHGRW